VYTLQQDMGRYGLCRVDSGQQGVRQYHQHRVGSMLQAARVSQYRVGGVQQDV